MRFRVSAHLGSLLAVLVAAGTVSVWMGAVLPSTSRAATQVWGAYGGGHWMAADPDGGYWTASFTGSVTPYEGAPSLGSPAVLGIHLSKPIMGMAATPTGRGYWLVASDGGVFSFGDATFYGSTGSFHLNQPIVGITATPTGRGYWLVASDGGVFSFGDATFYGSTGSFHLNQPIVGITATPTGRGYWLVASDGGIFSFGDAIFYGSTGSIHLNQPIVGAAVTPTGQGYWLVASDGGIFTFGDATFYGSLGGTGSTVLGLVVTPSIPGYSLVQSNGTPTAFTAAGPGSSQALQVGGQPVAIGGGTQGADCQPTLGPTATADSGLDGVFANETGPGWLGGDMAYSTKLPNGQESFVFSDTLIGTAQSSGFSSLTGIPRSSELVGVLPNLNTDISGTYGSPSSVIPDANGNDHWWTTSTYVEHGDQLVYVNEFAPASGGLDRFTGRSGIAVLSVPNGGMPSFSSITPLPTDPDTQWGNAVVQDASYTYVYGLDSDPTVGTFYGMKVARVPIGHSLQSSDWTYWNGSQWMSGEANAVAINTGAQVTGVVAQAGGSGYVAVSIPGGVYHASSVALSYACSPTGPWSIPQVVYSIPQITQYPNEFAYSPTFHTELTGQGGLVVSYCINSTNSVAVMQNVHQYQPQFLLLNN
jgi:hypothetical protein